MKLSVIIPTYNNYKFFNQFLTCLTNQNEKDCEFIIVDDGSDSNIYMNLKALVYKYNDSRIRLLRQKRNQGYGSTVNYGIKNSCGKYIAIYEPDDIIPEDYYSDLLKCSDNIDVDIIKYNGLIRRKNGQDSLIFSYDNVFLNKSFSMQSYKRIGYAHPSITNGIYNRRFLTKNNIKFCTGKGASYQDQQFRISLWYANPSIFIINKSKYIYLSHGEQSVSNHNEKIENIIFNWIEEYKHIRKYYNDNLEFYFLSFFREIKGMKRKLQIENYLKIKNLYKELINSSKLDLKKSYKLKKNLIEFIHFNLF